MAKIYPERLPVSIHDDPKRNAERRVYAALKSLSSPYLVFYSVHWQTISNYRGMEEGEADFVITHPDKGIVVLEVKGGESGTIRTMTSGTAEIDMVRTT